MADGQRSQGLDDLRGIPFLGGGSHLPGDFGHSPD